jgi:hypothetical protein
VLIIGYGIHLTPQQVLDAGLYWLLPGKGDVPG